MLTIDSPPLMNWKEELNERGINRPLKSNENVAPFEIKSSGSNEKGYIITIN